MMNITLEIVRDTWQACYSAERLAMLYDRTLAPMDVLNRTDGEWATVPSKDRIWTVLRDGVISDRILRLFACSCADGALSLIASPDPRSVNAITVSRRFAVGEASRSELTAARHAAYAARHAAAAYAAAAYAAYATDATDAQRILASLLSS